MIESTILFLVIGLCVLGFVVYLLLYYDFDKNIKQNYERLAADLYRGPLAALLNGSGINNIPRLNLVSTNPAVNMANRCGNGPLYIGLDTATDVDCQRTCVNDSARALNVGANETVVYEKRLLEPGAHCLVNSLLPECNMKTTVALMTINSVVCQSKFPRLVGGQLGNHVVACNNASINDPQNVLWDFKTNTRFDPWTTELTDQDELLADGTYRFACHYNGLDDNGNQYQAHPYDRLHPIRNYCAHLVYAAHPDVKTVWSSTIEEGNNSDGDNATNNDNSRTFVCECGDASVTRVQRLDVDDPTSPCSDVQATLIDDVKSRKLLTVPYKCFSLYSPIDEVGRYLPCPNDQFTRQGSQMATVSVALTENRQALIEHPLYADLTELGAYVKRGLRIV